MLHDVLIAEGIKAYRFKEVDKENDKGFFLVYKRLTGSISDIISEVQPDFKYPFALASNLIEMSNNHIYFAKHLPKLTDVKVEENQFWEVENMLNYFADRLLAKV